MLVFTHFLTVQHSELLKKLGIFHCAEKRLYLGAVFALEKGGKKKVTLVDKFREIGFFSGKCIS